MFHGVSSRGGHATAVLVAGKVMAGAGQLPHDSGSISRPRKAESIPSVALSWDMLSVMRETG